MDDLNLKIIPYTGISFSVLSRFVYMYLTYKNKSADNLALLFCILSLVSSSLMLCYGVKTNDNPIIVRNSIEITLLTISSNYIIRNKIINYKLQNMTLPT